MGKQHVDPHLAGAVVMVIGIIGGACLGGRDFFVDGGNSWSGVPLGVILGGVGGFFVGGLIGLVVAFLGDASNLGG
jgi:hypothetical protein